MQDVNGSRFALLLGEQDWGACTLVADADDAGSGVELAALWTDRSRRSAVPFEFDTRAGSLHLSRRISRFRAGRGDARPDAQRRLGAAADASGNIYWIADDGRRIDVLSTGSRRVSVFWSMQPVLAARPAAGEFGPRAGPAATPARRLHAMAVTRERHLVAGLAAESGQPGGLLVFDLIAGGPPLTLAWPADWPFAPHDMAPRPCGGVAVLDREHARVWLLDRRLGMHAAFPVDGNDGSRPDDFTSPGAAPAPAPIVRRPWFDLAVDEAGGTDPVAIDMLLDDTVLVMDGAGADGFALVSVYTLGSLSGRASTLVARDSLNPADAEGFVLRGYDCALQPTASADAFADPARLVVVSDEGNQCLAFDLVRGSPSLLLDPVESFLPLRRFAGKGLVTGAASDVPGDTGLLYDTMGTWLPLVEQRRPRYAFTATLLTPVLDGVEAGCVWHRLVLDGCIPSGTQVVVAARAADSPEELVRLPFVQEPTPLLRPDGAELPWLLDGPGAATDAARGTGCWELLFQRAKGRFLQIRLTLAGDELSTPRLVALRAWFARFSYSRRYLPGIYQDDATSADFLERFLANFEGMFTHLEDRIAAASALFDVRTAPAETLDWLAGWLGLVLDEAMSESRRRQLIGFAMPLYQYRGTTQGVRLAVQLALSDCVRPEDFALPAPSQKQPYGVRVVERYLTRNLSRALLGETVIDAPRIVAAGQRWSPAEGGEGLQQRYRDWLAQAGVADAASAVYAPVAPATGADVWAGFNVAVLGSVPQLATALQQAWAAFHAGGLGAGLGADLPTDWPSVPAQRAAWRRFIERGLPGSVRRWLGRWQRFVSRRHVRIAAYQAATGLAWPQFDLVAAPAVLPGSAAGLADWALFEARLEPMAQAAHRFSVLLPTGGPLADAGGLAQDIELASRVVKVVKPAHTSFDVRQYWALFRLGQARVGLDSLLGRGSRAPELAPPIVVGAGHVGAGRVGLRPDVPADRILLEC